jgi:hypothetical protein
MGVDDPARIAQPRDERGMSTKGLDARAARFEEQPRTVHLYRYEVRARLIAIDAARESFPIPAEGP